MSAEVVVIGIKPMMDSWATSIFSPFVTLKAQPSSLRMSTFPVNLDVFLDKQ